jgi:hypothetical protein
VGFVDTERLARARAALAGPTGALASLVSIGPAPVEATRDAVLAVLDPLTPILPRAGLARGQVVSCQGAAAMSLALALAAGPTEAGSWAGVVGLPTVGIQAAAELGVAVERTMFVASPPPDQWAVVLGAVIDGADVVIASAPARSVPAGETRRLQARLHTRGGVLLVVGDPGLFIPDLVLDSEVLGWEGLGEGHGHLTCRRVSVQVDGRRLGRPQRHDLLLPGPGGAVAAAPSTAISVPVRAVPDLWHTG